jgi:hypothetical protein
MMLGLACAGYRWLSANRRRSPFPEPRLVTLYEAREERLTLGNLIKLSVKEFLQRAMRVYAR